MNPLAIQSILQQSGVFTSLANIVSGLFKGSTKHLGYGDASEAALTLARDEVFDKGVASYKLSETELQAIGKEIRDRIISYLNSTGDWANNNLINPKQLASDIQTEAGKYPNGRNVIVTPIYNLFLWIFMNEDTENTDSYRVDAIGKFNQFVVPVFSAHKIEVKVSGGGNTGSGVVVVNSNPNPSYPVTQESSSSLNLASLTSNPIAVFLMLGLLVGLVFTLRK